MPIPIPPAIIIGIVKAKNEPTAPKNVTDTGSLEKETSPTHLPTVMNRPIAQATADQLHTLARNRSLLGVCSQRAAAPAAARAIGIPNPKKPAHAYSYWPNQL